MALTATQKTWVLSNSEKRIVTVEFPVYGELEAVFIANEGWMPEIGPLYDGRILNPWTLKRSVGGQIVGGGRTIIALGNIEVANADGKLGWMVQDWHKRPVIIRWGDPDWLDITEHIVVHNGFVDDLQGEGLIITIRLSDDREALNVVWPRTRYSANTSTGEPSGVLEGLGEIKPMAHGKVINADTVLLHSGTLHYGVAHSEIENRFTSSQEYTDPDWTKSVAIITVDQIEAPDGSLADEWESTGTTSILRQSGTSTTVERTVWALVRAVAGTVDVVVVNGSSSSPFTVDTNWVVISHTSTNSGTSRGMRIDAQIGLKIYVARMQWETGNTVTVYNRTAAYPIIKPDIVKVRDNGLILTEGMVPADDWEESADGIIFIDNVVGRITADTEAGSGFAEDVFVRLLAEVGVIKFDPVSTEVMPLVEVSIWSNQSRPMIDYLDAVVNSVGCVLYPSRDGEIKVALLGIPGIPAFEFNQDDIQGQIRSDLVTLPVDSISIGVKQSWAGQDADGLAAILPPEEKKLLSNTTVFIVASNDPTLETAEEAPEELETIDTLMRIQSEAQTTGRVWQNMLSVKRELHNFTLLRGASLLDLASTIRISHLDVEAFAGLKDENGELIVDENFFGIEQGIDMVVLSLEESFPFGSVDVEGWS